MRLFLLFLLFAAPALAQQTAPPATLEINGAFLARIKAHPPSAILDAVRFEADQAMRAGPFSVMDKKDTPPSGDKHDYMSLGPYWWPNPATKNGLPYIRHDGEVNPDRYKDSDDREFNELEGAIHALGLGYYFTGNKAYAARGGMLLRTWFLAPATRMNPNLNFAQAVPGVNSGRGTGLIDLHQMSLLLDGITLLSGSPALTAADKAGLRKWFTEYLHWLETSKNGHDESNAKNNHGNWFDDQIVGIALYLGDKSLAHGICETAKTKRIASEIEPDGSEPRELVRTKSYSYSIFALDALTRLAEESRLVGVDLWSYRAPDGASMRAALEYLLPYAVGTKKWTHQALNGVDPDWLTEPLLYAAIHYRDAAYLADAKKFERRPNAEILLLQQEAKLMLAGS
ncbi:MAG: alginate lyase family protein [Terracidiphilus sp.]